jgi:hypothetical protein
MHSQNQNRPMVFFINLVGCYRPLYFLTGGLSVGNSLAL